MKKFENSQAILINYQFENNYNHILTKLLSLVVILPQSLQLIIVSLPPDATFCDSLLAE